MTPDDDAATLEAQEADAEFGAGFSGDKVADKPTDKPAKPEAAAPEGATEQAKEDAPEFVQITRKDWEEVRAAAARTASYDAQFSKLFGTLGNQQKLVASLQSQTPRGAKVEIPKDAFAAMERDFPELAAQTRAALEAALAGVHGTGTAAAVDDSKIEAMMQTHAARREIEALEDAYPEWRSIVGAVDAARGEQPSQDNAFRKWLGTKDAPYQQRINNTESAAVISRAIRLFQNETRAAATAKPAVTTPRSDARAERIRDAVQPRGSNAIAAASRTEDDEFQAGFNSR